MSSTWFIVEATDNDHGPEPLGELLRFSVAPSLAIFKEDRTVDQILDAATAKGYECAFASSLHGASRFHLEKMESAVRRWLYAHGYEIKNRFDISIEPKARILIP